jgi:lipopolysaccharide export system ATP-binding protein
MNDLPRPPSPPGAKPPRRSPLRELRELREKQERELREREPSNDAPAEARASREPPAETRERRDAPPETREVRETPRLVAQNDGLAVRNIGKQFKKRPVLRDVSLYVQRGEVVGLLGPNGAGKTTCFYIVTGLIAPDYGMITLDGHDITDLPMYRRSRLGVGYLPQEASIFRGLSVEANIRAILEVTEPEPERRDARLEELMAEFSITHLRRTPALALSGGERRRVEIARALASGPRFMLLDEPLAGIDPIAVNEIRSLVTHLKDRGIGVLITDHNVRETLDIVDRAYILHDGSVLMEGRPSEIVAHKDVRRVYLGERFSL